MRLRRLRFTETDNLGIQTMPHLLTTGVTRLCAACVSMLALAAAPSFAHAYVAANALAEIRITIESIVNLDGTDAETVVEIGASTQTDTMSAFTSGPVTASAASDRAPLVATALGLNDSTFIRSTASASGKQGLATALAQTGGELSFRNTSLTDSFELTLLVEYAFALSAAATPFFPGEYAIATATLELVSEDVLGFLLEQDWTLAANAPSLSETPFEYWQLILGPGEEDLWTYYADVSARLNAVPAPSALALTAPGLLLVAARRRRAAWARR
jgi:hypothetical protein